MIPPMRRKYVGFCFHFNVWTFLVSCFRWIWLSGIPSYLYVAFFTKEVDLWLAECPLETNRRLANLELTYLVKEATGIWLLQQLRFPLPLPLKSLQGLLMEVTTAYAADWPHDNKVRLLWKYEYMLLKTITQNTYVWWDTVMATLFTSMRVFIY